MTRRLALGVVICLSAHAASAAQSTGMSVDALVRRARQQPDTVREMITRALASGATAVAADHDPNLLHARRLANAYATAWSDFFFVRYVDRFRKSSVRTRRIHVVADSLRVAGITAIGRDGAPAAMRLWRESMRLGASISDDFVVAPAMLALGAGFYRQGNLDSAIAYVRRANDLAQRIGDMRTSGNALGILASVLKDRGELAAASALYRKASSIRTKSGDSRGIAADENNLGLIALDRGDLPGAKRSFTRALEINQREGRSTQAGLNLGNLAAIASREGEYAGADSLYRKALAIQRRNGDRAESAYLLHDLGRLLMRRGDYRDADAALTEALRIHEESGANADAIAVRIDLASLQDVTGNPEGALVTLRNAEQKASISHVSPDLRAGIALTRGDLLTQFGTFAAADSSYRHADQMYTAARNARGSADARQGRALLLHMRGDDAEALQLLRQIERFYKSASDLRSAAITGIVIADVQRSGGEYAGARATLLTSLDFFRRSGDPVGEASALSALGDVALSSGMRSQGEAYYRKGIARLGQRRAPDIFWRVHSGLGDALRARGAASAAAKEYRTAIAAVENTASGVRLDERRSGFLADKWDVYTRLAMLEQSRAHPADAFAVSERMRARQMVEMLARGNIARTAPSSSREQDLRRRMSELTRQLEVRPATRVAMRGPLPDVQSSYSVSRQLDAVQKAYAELLMQLQERDPEYVRLVSAKTVSLQSVTARLGRKDVLLEYLLGDSTSAVFVVTADTIAAIPLRAGRQDIADLVEFARRTIERPDDRNGTALWRVPLRRLYALLIEPVERGGYLRGKTSLVIVPNGELHFLSFGALMPAGSADHFLVERFQVGYTPSATTWVRLGERALSPANGNVLALAPRTDRLPASRDEVLAIKRIYAGRATVKIGVDASESLLRSELRRAGTVHLATSGVLNKHNPLFSFVELAPSSGGDGRLEVNEVFGLGLSGQLVVLSACQTALGSGTLSDVPAGDEWVGLVQAFLQGGARSVVASLWPVEDRSTAFLMEEFHKRLAVGRPAVTALAEAQRVLLGKSATARPFYWAGFVFNGGAAAAATRATNYVDSRQQAAERVYGVQSR